MSRSIRSTLNRWFRPTPVTVRRARLGVEALERREVPATYVSATTLTYQDVDGDDVTVKFSKNVLTKGNVNNVVKFNAGDVNDSNATKQALWKIDLTAANDPAGTTVTTKAVVSKSHGGDGFANLGELIATNLDLGAVTIDGDLGRVRAGDTTTKTTGLNGLTAQSMGRYGMSTGAMDLHSKIHGKLASLTVKGDVKEAYVQVTGGADGKVGTVTINGSLIGGMMDDSGSIFSEGSMGTVTIKGDLAGGAGTRSATVMSEGSIAAATVGGSLKGDGMYSASFHATGNLGPVKVTGDVDGGGGSDSGSLRCDGKMGAVTIGGSLLGGAGTRSGCVFGKLGLGAVTIAGDVAGGTGYSSGVVFNDSGSVTSVTIGGSLRGGGDTISGNIELRGSSGAVKVAGDVVGGIGTGSGTIFTFGKLASVTVGGSVVGGTASQSGRVYVKGELGAVKITGSVLGGAGTRSGEVNGTNKIASVTIGGSLKGGVGNRSGSVYSDGEILALTITGDLVGGSAFGFVDLEHSGFVGAKRIGALTVGSIVAGTDSTFGTYLDNGAVRVDDDLGTVLVKGSLLGNKTNPVIISARGQAAPKGSTDVAIGSLTVSGRAEFARILAGYDREGKSVNADAQVGAVKVGGDWIASTLVAGAETGNGGLFGDGDDKKIDDAGVKDVAAVVSKIKSVTIGGQALGSFAIMDHFGIVAQQVDAVKIGGTPLVLTAGAGNDDFFLGITGDFKVNEI